MSFIADAIATLRPGLPATIEVRPGDTIADVVARVQWGGEWTAPAVEEVQAAIDVLAPKAAAKTTARDELLAGYVVQTEGFTLRATRDAQDSIDKLVSHVERLLGLGTITTETPVTILDASGTARQVSALRLRQIAASYGAWVLAREMVLRS